MPTGCLRASKFGPAVLDDCVVSTLRSSVVCAFVYVRSLQPISTIGCAALPHAVVSTSILLRYHKSCIPQDPGGATKTCTPSGKSGETGAAKPVRRRAEAARRPAPRRPSPLSAAIVFIVLRHPAPKLSVHLRLVGQHGSEDFPRLETTPDNCSEHDWYRCFPPHLGPSNKVNRVEPAFIVNFRPALGAPKST